MANSANITVTNHRLRKAMSNVNDDDISARTKKASDELKSELSLKIGKVMKIYPTKDKAILKLINSNKKVTCLIAHDILSEGMNVIGFPKGKAHVDDNGKTYIVPSENIYGIVAYMKNDKNEKVLLSFVSLSDKSVFGNAKPGEYKIQVDDNIISVTDKYINIKSKNLFINGLPYTEAYEPLDDYYDKKEINNAIGDFVNKIYPVGSIYMSMSATNPSKLFGGTWERIKDTFLLSSGDLYETGSTGGESTHMLTVDEIPSHNHTYITAPHSWAERDSSQGQIISPSSGAAKNITKTTNNEGGGQTHNNMPPYLTVNMWIRIG